MTPGTSWVRQTVSGQLAVGSKRQVAFAESVLDRCLIPILPLATNHPIITKLLGFSIEGVLRAKAPSYR